MAMAFIWRPWRNACCASLMRHACRYAPGVQPTILRKLSANAVRDIRRQPLAKPPGIAEAVEWANAATVLEKSGSPWPEAFRRAIGVVVKDEEDLACLAPELDAILEEALA